MGCSEGRSSETWIDFDFYGHQIVAHCTGEAAGDAGNNPVDGHGVPVPHFGIVLELAQWEALAEPPKAAGTKFEIEPYVRFKGQEDMFIRREELPLIGEGYISLGEAVNEASPTTISFSVLQAGK